jgi:hypothetical protein
MALRKLNTEPSHQISVHLAKQFQRRRFLEIDQLETRIAYGLLPRDISFVFMSLLKKSTSFSLYCKEIYPDKKNSKMNRNLVGSIYGRYSIKIAHFVPIR